MISSRLIEFWCFGLPAALGRGQEDGGCLEAWGCLDTWVHACACTHMHTHTCIHVQKLQMATDMEASMFIMFIMFNMHVCMCLCAWDPSTYLYPPPPPSTQPQWPQGGTARISKNSITLELIKIFQFCLKIWNLWRPPPHHGWLYGLVGGWVDGWGQIKSLTI